MSQSSSKRRGIIPCGSSGCSSASSDGRNPLCDDDDEIEAQLYSPPSPSECQKFHMPEVPKTNGSLFERRLSSNGQPPVSATTGEVSNSGVQLKRRPGPALIGRPATSAASTRRAFGNGGHPSPGAQSRSSTAISFQSSSTSSDDYSISLPSGGSSTAHRSATARGRHITGNSMSDESRTASRQSIMTTSSTYSILDTRQIHLYLKKNDSQLSLSSIQTMSQLTMDANGDETNGSGQMSSSSNSIATNSSSTNEKHSSNSTSNRAFHSAPRLRPGAEAVAMWRSATHSPDDEQYPRPRSQYIGELVWQVDQLVYCGGIQAAQNLNLLCRLNIEYIVDLCGEESETIARYYRPRPECPCLCTRKTAHSRMTMTINLKDDSEPNTRVELSESQRQDIITYFGDLINIIQKARISGKCVLIHSMKGRNRAPAFAAAYLMHSQRCTRVQALSQISVLMSKTRPGLAVSDNFLRALNHWQNLMGIKSNEGFLTQNSATVFQVKKTAWNG